MLLNQFPKTRILNDDQLALLLDHTYRILEEIGCVFTYEPALDLLEALPGTKVDRDAQRVYFDRSTVQRALRTCPNPFTLHARNPAKTVQIGGDYVTFATVIGSPFVRDLKRGRRPGTLADLAELVKIAHMVPEIDVIDSNICEPQDLDVEIRSLWRVYTTFKHCDRPIAGSSFGTAGVEDSMAIADLVFGERVDRPVFITIANPISPLLWDDRMSEAIIGYARRNQAMILMSGVISGITGTVTFAGTLAQGYAEQLAGLTLAQAARPGAPVVFGSGGNAGDMKVGAPVYGGPERALSNLIGAQVARHLKLPNRTHGCTTDSKVSDLQSGWERMLGMLTAVLGGANHIVHAAGNLESFLCASYEQLVADADIIGIVSRLVKGIEISPATLAFDVIKEVGPQGLFLTTEHTYEHFRGSYFEPMVADRLAYSEWTKRGSKTAEERAYERWNELLAKHEAPPLDPAAEREILRLIEARERSIATTR